MLKRNSTKSEIIDNEVRRQLVEMNPLYLPRDFKMLPSDFDPVDFPPSYKSNTAKEARLLEYSENFRRQYAYLCPDRTRLFLSPFNECGIKKLVCTTVRPTRLPYPEFYTWNGAASFVADFLSFVPLLPSTELPTRFISPSTCMNLQMGTCFEYANLLCSLLIGVGYDAYVVSGYATRECCYADESREICHLLIPEKKHLIVTEDKPFTKYQIKPQKDLTSKFEIEQEVLRLKQKKEEEIKRQEDEKNADNLAAKPLTDPLYGLRVHAWVLVLAGHREVNENFFIETLTGRAVDLKTPMYLGIESVWNNWNYWANMQDCSKGISKMQYSLYDDTKWEFLLPTGYVRNRLSPADVELSGLLKRGLDISSSLSHFQTTLKFSLSSQMIIVSDKNFKDNVGSADDSNTDSEDGNTTIGKQKIPASLEDKALLFDLPRSWTLPIVLSAADYDKRYPEGKKVRLYIRTKHELFSPYTLLDGLVMRLTIYSDRELIQPLEEQNTYKHRVDRLLTRNINRRTNFVVEKFDHGRKNSKLSEHGYCLNSQGPDAQRYMLFYDKARVDGLTKRERTADMLREHFVNRDDRLYYRETHYGRKLRKFGVAHTAQVGEAEGGLESITNVTCLTKSSHNTIDKIIERFERNPQIDADEDIHERIFNIIDDRYLLTYHVSEESIFPCTQEFLKPVQHDDRRVVIQLYCDTFNTFQVNPYAQPKTQVEIYNILLGLLSAEEQTIEQVRKSESEVEAILSERAKEEMNIELEIGLFDTLRNRDTHDLRINLEAQAEWERMNTKEKELDYLAPYFEIKNVIDLPMTRKQAFAVREACLQNCKESLIKKANIIQCRFEAEIEALQNKQYWFQNHQINLTKEDEQAYLQYCSNAIFRITTLENMLMRHKESAPRKYMALEKRLRLDSRLSDHLQAG